MIVAKLDLQKGDGVVSLGDRFAAKATAGFDYARLFLALAVVFWHTFNVTYGIDVLRPYIHEPIMVLVRVILPMFFALSGFLVSSSLERSPSLAVFLWHRVIRIFPALTVEVLMSALVLGPLVTTVTLSAYFSDSQFYAYLMNALGIVHFVLPGVFLENPVPGMVNGSLWTVPAELECYIAISILFLIGLTRRPKLLLGCYLAVVVALTLYQIHVNKQMFFMVGTYTLTTSFVAGMIVYQFKHRLPGGLVPAVLSLALACVLLYFRDTQIIATLPAAYAIAAFGCLKPPRSKLLFGGDYSYGLYLYAYPIQQTVVYLIGPGKFLATFVLSVLAMACFAVFSWHVIEKRVLTFKHSLPAILAYLRGLLPIVRSSAVRRG